LVADTPLPAAFARLRTLLSPLLPCFSRLPAVAATPFFAYRLMIIDFRHAAITISFA